LFIFYISKALEKALENAPPAGGGVGVGGKTGTNTGPGDGVIWEVETRVPPKETAVGLGGIYFFKGICIFVINITKKPELLRLKKIKRYIL
jgi:hypothetical protein